MVNKEPSSLDKTILFQISLRITSIQFYFSESAYTERYMGIPSEDTFSWYEEGSLIRKAHQLYGKSKDFLLAHGMADTNVHLQNSMVLAKELVKYNVTFQQQVIILDT